MDTETKKDEIGETETGEGRWGSGESTVHRRGISLETQERLRKMIEEGARQVAAEREYDEATRRLEAEELLHARHKTLKWAQKELSTKILGKNVPPRADPFWDEVNVFLARLNDAILVNWQAQPELAFIEMGSIYLERVWEIKEGIRQGKYDFAYDKLIDLFFTIGQDEQNHLVALGEASPTDEWVEAM